MSMHYGSFNRKPFLPQATGKKKSPGDCGRALFPMLLYMSAYNVAMFLGTYVLSTLDRLSGQMGEIILF